MSVTGRGKVKTKYTTLSLNIYSRLLPPSPPPSLFKVLPYCGAGVNTYHLQSGRKLYWRMCSNYSVWKWND